MASGVSPASAIALRTLAMIGLPPGLGRVRWNESAISPQPAMTPRTCAPRALAAERLSSTSAAAPSAITKPSRFLENGFAAAAAGSFWVESAERSEKRIRVSGFTVPSVPTHSAASVSPRRIASSPSWIALAPDAQAVVTEMGDPCVPNVSAKRSAIEANKNRGAVFGKSTGARSTQHVVVIEGVVAAGERAHFPALRPLHLIGWYRDE